MSHFNFSFREDNSGVCCKCQSETVLVCFGEYGEMDYEDAEENDIEEEDRSVYVGELTGHYCRKCERLVSLCLNDRE